MATSGTVATTTIDTAALLEHSIRRCGIPPSAQTPEIVQMAKENMYLLLLGLSNAGLNLWAVEKAFMGLTTGQPTYVTPPGTLDVLNVVYSTPTRITGTETLPDAKSIKTALTTATSVLRIGIYLNAVAASNILLLEASTDDLTYTTLVLETRTDWAIDTWYWYDVPSAEAYAYFKAEFSTGVAGFTEFYLASAIQDLPVTQWNRDTYSVINNKFQQSSPSTSYFYEKKLTPEITLWPVPNGNYNHLMIYRHRQPQDIGTLLQQVEIPQRWMDGFVWLLSARICFELPGVDPQKQTLIVQMADKVVLEAEQSETDGAPIYLTPGIGVYTR